MRTSDFDYPLPPELIAQAPIEPRDASRLLVLHRDSGQVEHSGFRDVEQYLRPGDLLVANESRVIPARLLGHKVPTGGRVEMLLLKKRNNSTWEVLLKPGRRVQPGAVVAIERSGTRGEAVSTVVNAQVLEITPTGGRVVAFSVPIEPWLSQVGVVPLPPYIRAPLTDPERYQTVYSHVNGSVAAPTAGLHFTSELLELLSQKGIGMAFLTLHISLDTFRPVQEEQVETHAMYTEYCELPPDTCAAINRTRAMGGRVVAVGTTTVRVLETAAKRFTPESMELQPFSGLTNIFIYPGFRFRVVDTMITNFHLPRSTLLMLVAAFAGKARIDHAYQEAIRERYRFYSFGDAMLIL